jgi:hypothetical protein
MINEWRVKLKSFKHTKANCSNHFIDGKAQTTSERYTAAWIKLINLLERSK